MDYADVLKWLMVGTMVPLIGFTVLFFAGFWWGWLWVPAGVLYWVGRAFFVAWFITLIIALANYVRSRGGKKRITRVE